MAASGSQTIQLYYSTTSGASPVAGNLASGEIAININDGKLYYKDSSGNVQLLASKAAASGSFSDITASGNVTLSAGTANGVAYLNGSKVLTTGSALTFDGTNIALKVSNGTQGYVLGVGNEAMVGSDASTYYFGAGWGGAPAVNFQFGSTGTTYQRWLAGGSEQMRLTSTGLGIGTSSVSNKLEVAGTDGSTTALVKDAASGNQQLRLATDSVLVARSSGSNGGLTLGTISQTWGASGGFVKINTNGSTVATFNSSGNLGLGVTPSAWGGSQKGFQLGNFASVWTDENGATASLGSNVYQSANSTWRYVFSGVPASRYTQGGTHAWFTAASGTAGNAITFTQAMTLDASGNLGIGVTSMSNPLVVGLNANSATQPMVFVNPATGTNASIQYFNNSGSGGFYIGRLNSAGGGVGSGLPAYDSVVWNTGSQNLLFGTGNTERARIDSSGNLLVNTTSTDRSTNGIRLIAGGSDDASIIATNARDSGGAPIEVNRQVSDGTLVAFYQAGTAEGTISVSGTTVSYNGGHLARYAQTVGAKDESLVKGTVLSNLDQMNVYTDAEGNSVSNEQLNKVKVSDIEGDANVAGVFVNWSHDEQHNVDEINMAMTGDMIIRIAQGITVARGDLLMSAGDGTAKPQGDDIVRSKTIAKVTSTHVTCTYADGSFCVPCVLMAC